MAAFYGDAHGVAHAVPAEPWFERTTVIFDLEGVFNTRRSRSLADLVEAATESLFGEGSSVTVEFDPNAWADQLPKADRESGPDQRGASAPREYADAHRRDAVLHTATGRNLNPARNAGQKAAAVKRVVAALKRGEGISPSERAWRTALSIHLGEVEDPAERLLLLLQSRGRRKWADLESGAANPAELKAAARELADAGRLKLLRGRVSGARYIAATEALEGEKRAELERALTFVRQALSLAEPTGSRKHAGRARLLNGRALLAAGAPPEEALAPMQRARNLARSTGYPPLLWTSGAELAQLHSRLGHEPEAAACRGETVASVKTVADGIGDASLRRSLLGTPTVQAILSET